VCSTIRPVGLGATSCIDPDTHGRGLGVWGVLGGNLFMLSAIGIAYGLSNAYGEAIAQGGALSLDTMADGGCETASDGRSDGIDGGTAAQTLPKAQRKLSRSH